MLISKGKRNDGKRYSNFTVFMGSPFFPKMVLFSAYSVTDMKNNDLHDGMYRRNEAKIA